MDEELIARLNSLEKQIEELRGKVGAHGRNHEISGNDTVRLSVRDDGTDTTGRQRTINFVSPLTVSEDTTNQEYDIGLSTAAIAPHSADYLVGTANGSLSAEIVVGTTPGGELGGTWASPTVDATHSGTSHAALPTQTGALTMGTARFKLSRGTTVTAANDLTLGSDGNMFVVDGSTQINAIATADWQDGSEIILLFGNAPTVKHNTAGGAGFGSLRLNGAADFVASSNDVLKLALFNSIWYETGRAVT